MTCHNLKWNSDPIMSHLLPVDNGQAMAVVKRKAAQMASLTITNPIVIQVKRGKYYF